MEVRYTPNHVHFTRMNTQEIRDNFLLESLFEKNSIKMTYIDIDRVIIGGAIPADNELSLTSADELRADYFCQRRELGVLNIGDKGSVTVDSVSYEMNHNDCLFIGMGSRDIHFKSTDKTNPAIFYLLSYPAHREYPTKLAKQKDSTSVHLGSVEESNKRTIHKYIHPDGIQSCQLVMGITELESGSVWNTMPPHTHERRMEVYMYYDFDKKSRVFHLCGQPQETRHIVMKSGEAVVSPSWSIHSGVGTSKYTFCWGMGGENQAFDDMDHLNIDQLK